MKQNNFLETLKGFRLNLHLKWLSQFRLVNFNKTKLERMMKTKFKSSSSIALIATILGLLIPQAINSQTTQRTRRVQPSTNQQILRKPVRQLNQQSENLSLNFQQIPTQQGQGIGNFASNTFKAEFDQKVQEHFDDKDLPGIVVLMARDGMVTYKKSIGFADAAANQKVNENHVFRLASVSKWVAGVMALKLEEQGKINLNAKANSIIPELPAHHTSRVIDYLSCRGGIRHYGETTSPQSPTGWSQTVVNNAIETLPKLWHDPLINGGGGYHYSTHGYVFLAALVEQATGRTTPQLVGDLLRNPYGLSSLRTEDLSNSSTNRVKLYQRSSNDSSNIEVPADNLTWKYLGGGLEATPLDLLKLGMKVCDKQVISNSSLQRMMKRIEFDNGYALGCNTAIENGNPIIAKSGGQTGVSSYIWMAPEKRMVMVVMTNIQTGDASGLGKRLRKIALGTNNAAGQEADLIVESFERTGQPRYNNGKLEIPVRLRIKNQGKKGADVNFVNGIRIGPNYRWTSFMSSLTPNGGTRVANGVVRIADASKLNQGKTLTLIAMADAPIAAADTSIDPKARIFESNEANNTKVLKVKIPGGIGGFQVESRQPVGGQVGSNRKPTRVNPKPTRANPMPIPTRANPKQTPTRANPKSKPTRTNKATGVKIAKPTRPSGRAATTSKRASGKGKAKGKASSPTRTNPKKKTRSKSKPAKKPINKSVGETAGGKKRTGKKNGM